MPKYAPSSLPQTQADLARCDHCVFDSPSALVRLSEIHIPLIFLFLLF